MDSTLQAGLRLQWTVLSLSRRPIIPFLGGLHDGGVSSTCILGVVVEDHRSTGQIRCQPQFTSLVPLFMTYLAPLGVVSRRGTKRCDGCPNKVDIGEPVVVAHCVLLERLRRSLRPLLFRIEHANRRVGLHAPEIVREAWINHGTTLRIKASTIRFRSDGTILVEDFGTASARLWADQMVDIPVPLLIEEIVAARVQRIDEQIVEVPIPQITEDIVEVDVPVPQVDVQEISNAITALQFQVRTISKEIQEKYSGKREFQRKKHELKMQLDEYSKKIGALRASERA